MGAIFTVSEYVYCMEELMIKLAAENEVDATRSPRYHGVWAKKKTWQCWHCAVRHGIASHGLALNVNINLEPFTWVNSCALSGVQMTSLSSERGEEIRMVDIKTDLDKHISSVFGCSLSAIPKDQSGIAKHKQHYPLISRGK